MEPKQIDLYEFLVESELQQYYNSIKNELKITNSSHLKYATDEDLKQIGLSRPEIRRLRKFYEKYYPHGYLSKIKRLLQNPTIKRDEISTSNQVVSNEPIKTTNSPNKTPSNKHIIPADSICVNKQLGTGEFGIVQQGVWTNGTERIQVAIKCLCRERMQSNPMEFLKEAAIMHAIEHENIVRLYGVVLDTDSLMLVTELAHLRSLLECLKDSGLRVSFLTIPTLCEFAQQICNGMMYLENKRLIHRDLAARNILVFSKNKVKISDFGLSRALGVGKDYYKTNFNVNLKLPIAWCAPECINYLRFTNASDVWAYGVCLWEMFSYGFQPWAALTGLQILDAIDEPNYQRLEQPECCPREYYSLMLKCWQHDPSKRPKFNEIYQMLPDIKPEQLKTIISNCELKKDHLMYRVGEIITVLDKQTNSPFWKGVLNSGKTGLFNPANTVAYLEGLPSSTNRDSFGRTSDRSSKRKLRTEMISSPQNDLKHTGHVGLDGAYFGEGAFIASSQNYNRLPRQIVTPYKPSEDIEQTPLLLPPTPTSPDSLQTASGYFPEDISATSSTNPMFINSNENTPKHQINSSFGGPSFDFTLPSSQTSTKQTSMFNPSNPFINDTANTTTISPPFALQNSNYGFETNAFTNVNLEDDSLLNQSTIGISGDHNSSLKNPLKWNDNDKLTTEMNESSQHEYHEISDDEITAEKVFDLGPSLLDEINSMFGSITAATVAIGGGNSGATSSCGNDLLNQHTELKSSSSLSGTTNDFDHQHTNKKNEIVELTSKLCRKNSNDTNSSGGGGGSSMTNKTGTSKKKSTQSSGTVKQISLKDEKILNQAIEIANEISARSMTDLVNEHPPITQSPKRKFSFRFPNLSHHNSIDKDAQGHGQTFNNHTASSNMKERKNFSEELRNIPDLQSSITDEHREAYNSLIEKKTSSSTLVGKFDTNEFKLAKTLPRKFSTTTTSSSSVLCLSTTTTTTTTTTAQTTSPILLSSSKMSSSFFSSKIKNLTDLSIPNHQAPRPTTLPNRSSLNKIKKIHDSPLSSSSLSSPSSDSNPLRILRDKNYPIIKTRQKNSLINPNDNNENINPQKFTTDINNSQQQQQQIQQNSNEKDLTLACESPSYLTNTLYTFPDNYNSSSNNDIELTTLNNNMQKNCNPIPLPPRDRNKIITTNAKRHVRKHPLIIPAYGVQRTLNKLNQITPPVDDQQKFVFPSSSSSLSLTTETEGAVAMTKTVDNDVGSTSNELQVEKNLNHSSLNKKHTINSNKLPKIIQTNKSNSTKMKICDNQQIKNKQQMMSIDEISSFTNDNNEKSNKNCINNQQEQRTYENISDLLENEHQKQSKLFNNNTNTDAASLQFEMIVEDRSNKCEIISSPDVVDGCLLSPFSIKKEHYNKQNDIIDFGNCTKISGLYVNEDELRNLDIEKKKVEFIQKHPKYLEPKNELNDNALFNKIRETVNLSIQQKYQENSIDNDELLKKTSTPIKTIDTECNSVSELLIKKKLELNSSKSKCNRNFIKTTDLDAPDNDDDDDDGNNNNDDDNNDGDVNDDTLKKCNSSTKCDKEFAESHIDNDNKSSAMNNVCDDLINHTKSMNDCNSVSCEDLLEFSDIKPKGYERGVDSDEVRIMLKVLGKDILPERCLETLEFIEWDVHRAIKIIKLQNILSTSEFSLQETVDALKKYDWDLQVTALKLKGIK